MNLQGEYDGGSSSPYSKPSTRHSFVIMWDGPLSDWSEHRMQMLEQALLESKVDLVSIAATGSFQKGPSVRLICVVCMRCVLSFLVGPLIIMMYKVVGFGRRTDALQ
jgi:hypothetical protein